MKKYANAILKNLTTALELVIAALLAAGIIIMTAQLILSFGNLTDLNTYPNYDDLWIQMSLIPLPFLLLS